MATLPPLVNSWLRLPGAIQGAIAAPGQERDERARRRSAQETANLAAQAQGQQLETQDQQARMNLRHRQDALPVSTQEAVAGQEVAERGKRDDHARVIDLNNNRGEQVRSTLSTATDGRLRIIDANIQGDLAKYTGWNDTIGARQDSIINRAWDHEKGMARMFVGDTPALDGMRQELQNDRDMVMQMEQNRRNNPLEWVNAANQTALTLRTLFL